MNEKLKMPLVLGLAAAAIVTLVVLGYHYFGPERPMPKPVMVSISDLVRQESKDPSVLTADQRKLLATIPESEKQQLMAKKGFSLADVQSAQPVASK